MILKRIQGTKFRNYSSFSFSPSPSNTIILGENGSGKTSLLEAIYLLGSGKSFRTSRLQRLLNIDADEFTLYAEFTLGEMLYRAGLSRNAQQFTGVKLNNHPVASLSELVRHFPVQVFHSNSTDMVYGAAELRRRFVDWGLFHVEPEFHELWRQLNKIIKQRNKLLKEYSINAAEIAPWDKQLVLVSGKINSLRQQHVEAIRPYLISMYASFDGSEEIDIALYPGWPEKASLEELLLESFETDRQRGFTSRGAHRADLRLLKNKMPVRDLMSRGQIKTLSILIGLAQLHYLVKEKALRCLVLVDDLAAELDSQHMTHLVEQLSSLGLQTIYTALSHESLPSILLKDKKAALFHVEQGGLKVVDES